MQKRITSLTLSAILLISMISCGFVNTYAAEVTTESVSATASQTNAVLRADAMYGATWKAKANVTGWRGNNTFTKGNSYRIPYGQPVNAGKYVGFSISVPDFLTATTSSSNVFYSSKSSNGSAASTYYANDCSAFVSYCWGVSRHTTATLGGISTSYGLCNSSNVDKLKIGDALNYSGSHVVLVTDVKYSGSTVSSVEITEQTPPQLKRSTYTRSGLVSKYGSKYKILRYSGTVPAPYFNFEFNANGGSGTMSNQKINYAVSTAIKKNTFTRSGYTFAGWNAYRTSTKLWYYTNGTSSGWYEKGSQPSGYSLYTYKDAQSISKTGYGVSDTVRLYATWKQASNEFTFEFNANGGTGTMANQKIKYGTDTKISENKFTRDGYEFAGWTAQRLADNTYRYTNGTDSNWYAKGSQPAGYYYYLYKDNVTVSKTGLGNGDTVKLSAVWARANYKVHFDSNGGTGTMSDLSCRNGVHKAFTANAFSKSGSTFAGWYLTRQSDGKSLYTNNGSSDNAWYLPGKQPEGFRLSLYENQRVFSALSNSEGDIVTCTAQWAPNADATQYFYIDFNANGGTGTMDRQKIEYGVSTATTKNAFTRFGYNFKGWAAHRRAIDKWLYADASGETIWLKAEDVTSSHTLDLYPNGGKVAKTTSTDSDIVTFYAVWERCGTGDVDCNGTIDITDVTLLQKYIASMVELDAIQIEIADANHDGWIDVKDATIIQKYIAGFLSTLEEEKEPEKPTVPTVTYFPASDPAKSDTLLNALASINVDNSYSYRKEIAVANGITGYSGTAEQNVKMLDLLKAGKLIKP